MMWKYKTTSNCAKLELLESISYIKTPVFPQNGWCEAFDKLRSRGQPYEKLCISQANTWGWHKRCLYSKRTTWKHVWSLSLTCPWDQLCFKKSTWQFTVEDNGKTWIFDQHSAYSLHGCTFCHKLLL